MPLRAFTAIPRPQMPPPQTEGADKPEAGSRRGWLELPEGAVGVAFLLLLAAFSGGLIAVYWPFGQSATDGTADRLALLESKVDALAAGHAGNVAARAFATERRSITELGARLDADEARVSALEKTLGAAAGIDLAALAAKTDSNATAMAALGSRLERIEDDSKSADLRDDLKSRTQAIRDALAHFDTRIATLEKSVPATGLAQKLDQFALKSEEGALETRVLKLESLDLAGVMRKSAAVMALADLIRASNGSAPFQEQLAALKNLAPALPEIQDLSRFAAKGVPTRIMIADSFPRSADTALAAERAQAAGNSFGERVWSGVVSMVTARRQAPADSAVHLSKAQIALNLGEIQAAIKEVSALTGPARDAAEPWLKSANDRLTVDRDSRTLAERLVADLSPAPAPTLPGGAALPK